MWRFRLRIEVPWKKNKGNLYILWALFSCRCDVLWATLFSSKSKCRHIKTDSHRQYRCLLSCEEQRTYGINIFWKLFHHTQNTQYRHIHNAVATFSRQPRNNRNRLKFELCDVHVKHFWYTLLSSALALTLSISISFSPSSSVVFICQT